MARRFGVRVYDFANVGSDLHRLIRSDRRETFQAFLRSFAGIVARRVTGARRGTPVGRFFSGLAWSRVVRWVGGDRISKELGISWSGSVFEEHDRRERGVREDMCVR